MVLEVKKVNTEPSYSDLDLDMMMHPTTKGLVIKKGVEAVKRSIRNLVFTNYYDRPFRSYIGSDVRKLLFENMDPMTDIMMQQAITVLINNFEPRVNLTKVTVVSDYDNNGFNVTIEYVILEKNITVVSTLFLERIR